MNRVGFALRLFILLGGLAACHTACDAQSPQAAATSAAPSLAVAAPHALMTAGEARATHALDRAKAMGPGELYALLKSFPKGADLHMHLSGAIYAETLIAEAARQGLCVASVEHRSPAQPTGQDAVRLVAPAQRQYVRSEQKTCAPNQVPASSALADQPLYDDLVDSLSMRSFVPTQGISGHDQFFSTFARFDAVTGEAGEWLDEVVTRAAAQNEQYLEIMQTPQFSHAAALGYKFGWPADAANNVTFAELARLRQQLLSAGLDDEVAIDRSQLAGAEQQRNALEHCASGRQTSKTVKPSSACAVRVHWLYQVLRGFPPQQVFAQTLLGFEVVSAAGNANPDSPDVVGINFVMPEDGYLSMRDYHLQMEMLDYLHSVYPRVPITLHAGELAPGMVPPAGLSFHIRQAIELGHAERIGHGVDLLYEDHPRALLQEMMARHIMVEINLTSNAVILGIKGRAHPLHAYMAAHVPWALSTDDEGVSRIDLTHEYVRGVEEQGLTYLDLKRSARTSLEHSFLHGQSLWAVPDDFNRRRTACAAPITAASQPSEACRTLLNSSEKAAAQWELERRLAAFEAAP